MDNGRNYYTFQLGNNDPSSVNNMIMNWLNSNGFKNITKNNETYYNKNIFYIYFIGFSQTAVAFQYQINDGVLNICLWIPAVFGDKKVETEKVYPYTKAINKVIKPLFDSLTNALGQFSRN